MSWIYGVSSLATRVNNIVQVLLAGPIKEVVSMSTYSRRHARSSRYMRSISETRFRDSARGENRKIAGTDNLRRFPSKAWCQNRNLDYSV